MGNLSKQIGVLASQGFDTAGNFGQQVLNAGADWGRGVQWRASHPLEALANALQRDPTGGMSPGALGKVGGILGQTVFHGSPHLFDKFSMSKVGTGEGAQAYGHGLYFAENPSIAREYAATVKGIMPSSFNVEGTTVKKVNGTDWYAGNKPITESSAVDLWRKENNNNSNLYKVDIPDEQIAKMLDWDKPLSEQTSLITALKNLGVKDVDLAAKEGMTGEWGHLQLQRGGTQTSAARRLASEGIPGIRYLDQGSRVAGKGTYNYVVFDENLPKILGRE